MVDASVNQWLTIAGPVCKDDRVVPVEHDLHPETAVRLRPLGVDDEHAVRTAQLSMAREGFEFAFGLTDETDWPSYVTELSHRQFGIDLPPGSVPASFLAAVSDGVVVGRSSIRHRLNDELRIVGEHVGYCVLPQFRRQGFATEICRQSVIIARAFGVDGVLLTCDADNVASKTVIERCGGILDSDWPLTGTAPSKYRYWIK
ncbi:putative acetyltransferase [Spelaeicoccus albus]|uniref:Putative acetyltransferase n=1 Tax=Spelaeicoccus albus TaxID=1280376 RepID=A0A7Z0AD96_9MICO|nr:putative acetyltransferase [Spelaeicoccus albus]